MIKIPAHIAPLIDKYLDGTATAEEKNELNLWYRGFNDEEVTVESKDLLTRAQLESRIRQRMEQTFKDASKNAKTIKTHWVKRFAAAAVVIGLLGIGIYFFVGHSKQSTFVATTPTVKVETAQSIQPGGNKAILTLANGSSIILDSASKGLISQQGNIKVQKLSNGLLSYTINGRQITEKDEAFYNTITTPKGGQYQVILSDGSKVWLNAASSLRFPIIFTGKERSVEITGEVYMEIAKNEHKPFKVRTGQMTVEVLGTHFNINAYDDESTVKTTLLEGRVKVSMANNASSEKILVPGQQSMYDRSGFIKVLNNADLEEAVAWKNGRFQFNSADLKSILRQLARWYDVTIEYRGNTNLSFTGQLTRTENVYKMLEMMELTGEVHFAVEGRKIIVTP